MESTVHTRICDLLGIEYPIIQAGMGPFTAAELASAVSNAGALGSLGAAQRPVADLREQIGRIRQRTNRPFAVNFVLSNFDIEGFALAVEAHVPVISFALGDPGENVQRAHDAGAVVIHQVHNVAQAYQAAERGVDVLVAQGGEAGGFGHYVATLPLVPQVVDAVRPLPVVAAGGIADGRGVAAALVLGAEGAQLGTRFVASREASVSEDWQQGIVSAQSDEAVKVEVLGDVLRRPGPGVYDTVPRTLRTPFSDQWAQRRVETAQQAETLRAEIAAAMSQGRIHEYVPFAGQSVGLIREVLPVEQIIRRLVDEANEALQRGATLVAHVTG